VVISCSESGRKSNQFFCGVELDFLCHDGLPSLVPGNVRR
jgi:hypothetical protein